MTTYQPPIGVTVEQRTLSTVVGAQKHAAVLNRLVVRPAGPGIRAGHLGVAVIPVKAERLRPLRQDGGVDAGGAAVLPALPASREQVGDEHWLRTGVPYSRGLVRLVRQRKQRQRPRPHLSASPFAALAAGAPLNGATQASDPLSGLCSAAFLWLPVDDFRGAGDFADLTAQPPGILEEANLAFWQQKLDRSGMQVTLPQTEEHLWAQYRSSRADLLILADDG